MLSRSIGHHLGVDKRRVVSGFLMMAAVGAALTGCGRSSPELSPRGQNGEAAVTGEWVAFPDSPLSPRTGPVLAELDDDLFVVGGDTNDPCPPIEVQPRQHQAATAPSPAGDREYLDVKLASEGGKGELIQSVRRQSAAAGSCLGPTTETRLNDGARFDFGANEWTSIASSPMPIAGATTAVLDGRLYVWVFPGSISGTQRAEFLSYDPYDDEWERLTSPPVVDGNYARIVATDDGVVANWYALGNSELTDYLYDVSTDKWSALPRDPLGDTHDRTMVWTGDRLILLGVSAPPPESAEPPLYRAAELTLADSQWRELPASEVVGGYAHWSWSAGRVVAAADGGSDGDR